MSGGRRTSSSFSSEEKRWGDTTSKRGEISRVFVGNIDSFKTTVSDLRQKFARYGQLNGIDVHQNGFAFVQFEDVDEAKTACEAETGTILHGRRVEVRMFDKKNKGTSNSGPGHSGPGGRGMRDRSPIRRTIANNNSNSGPEPFISGFHPQQNHFTSPAVMNTQSGIPMGGVPGPGLPFHRDSMNTNAGSYGPHHPAAHLSIPAAAVPPAAVNAVGLPPGAGGQPPVEQVNEIEIIVISKDQWQYAEMIEQRIRREIGIRAIDILFLHAPQHISMTLNDLFERRTLYALVVAPENEHQKTVTIHVLHNQSEFPNLPLDRAIAVIADDYRINGPPPIIRNDNNSFSHPGDHRNGSPFVSSSSRFQPQAQVASQLTPSSTTTSSSSSSFRIPDDVSALLRITLSEGGCQFLSLSQIDTIIEYFTRERDRLTRSSNLNNSNSSGSSSAAGLNSLSVSNNSHHLQNQNQQQQQSQLSSGSGAFNSGIAGSGVASLSGIGMRGSGVGPGVTNNLLDNPQVKQALNSLLSLGALAPTGQQQAQNQQQIQSDPIQQHQQQQYGRRRQENMN